MLTLPIKRKWFDMILSGEKKEEYRAYNAYYRARFDKSIGREMTCRFRNGYSRKSPTIECMVVPRYGYGRGEWGAEPSKKIYRT